MEKSGKRFYRNTKHNTVKIFRALKDAHKNGDDYISISEIARRTGMHKWTVSRTVDLWMQHFVDMIVPEELEHVGLKIKLVRLSDPDITEEGIVRSLKIRL